MSSDGMGILDHIEELRARFIKIIVSIAILSIFTFIFSIKEFSYGNFILYLPFPDIYDNISAQFIERMKADLLPNYVQLIVTNPTQAIFAQITTSLFLGIVLSMPVIVYQIEKYLSPALYPNEKRMISRILIPATILFSLGCIFSYFLITPFTLDFLYGYALPLGAQTFLTIDEFISFVFLFTLSFGLSFQLPIIMIVLTSIGLIEPEFWKKNFSYAVVAIVIFGAIITPDGSGITMWFVVIPMMFLYILGYLFVHRKVKVEP
ncbi:MAG: twin-arginine translocase subunit TatC [Candidatus Methylarchaceae archaeon HK02M2]|nr:twin-arginine translocase subunit TatC [Candidatus Methylarchaceae archaeon HK02M2]